MTWYMKGQSDYITANFHMAFYMDIDGFDEGVYDDQDIEGEGELEDPYMSFGIDTKTEDEDPGPVGAYSYGVQQVEIGLLRKSYKIKINTTGIYGFNPTTDSFVNLLTETATHTHDGDTLQLDGINSNGGAFSFTTTGTVTFNNPIAMAANEINDIGNLKMDSGDGIGLRFWDGATSYSIYMSAYGNATYGGRVEPTSDYNMYFVMTGGTNRGFVFCNGLQGEYFHITPTDVYSSAHIRVRDGHSFIAYSTGNDKYIQMYHDDVDGIITVPAGDGDLRLYAAEYIYLYPRSANADYLRFDSDGNYIYGYANESLVWNIPTGHAHYWRINNLNVGYWNVNDMYLETHIRIRNGHSLYTYSAGNDKHIRIYHSDTSAYFIVPNPGGILYFQVDEDIYIEPTYDTATGNWRMKSSGTFLYMANSASVSGTELNQIGRIGGVVRPCSDVYTATIRRQGESGYSHVDDLQLLREMQETTGKEYRFKTNDEVEISLKRLDLKTMPFFKARPDYDDLKDKDILDIQYEITEGEKIGFLYSSSQKLLERQDGIVVDNTTRDLIIENLQTQIDDLQAQINLL